MIYRILWKDREKPASYIASRDGVVVETSSKRIDYLKGWSVWMAEAKVKQVEATISCISSRTKL